MTTLLREPVDEVTRRRLLIGTGALGLVTALPVRARSQERGAFPVTIAHKYGRTEISKAPQHVVSVGLTEHDAILALGVKPVAVTEWFGDQPYATWPWAQDELGDATPEVLRGELTSSGSPACARI